MTPTAHHALDLLSEQYAVGRLDKDEFDERSDAVWSAKTQGDLAPVFADLPVALAGVAGPHGWARKTVGAAVGSALGAAVAAADRRAGRC